MSNWLSRGWVLACDELAVHNDFGLLTNMSTAVRIQSTQSMLLTAQGASSFVYLPASSIILSSSKKGIS